MESSITSSFIPSDAGVPLTERPSGSALYDFFLLISLVLLIASASLAVGVFLYAQYLSADEQSKKTQIERIQKAFEPSLMQDITRLDDRMRAGDTVLRAHTAISGFFRFLEKATLETISFRTLQIDANDQLAIAIKMTGVAQSVNSIALQADVFTKGGALSSPLFSNIARREEGITFDLTATVNSDVVRYTNVHVQSAPQQATEETPQLRELLPTAPTAPGTMPLPQVPSL